jgi:hypothetical protein
MIDMKVRYGFISNSSSTSFIIKNYTDDVLTVKDFLLENTDLIQEYNIMYSGDYTLEQCLKDKTCNIKINPGINEMEFGDEFATPINNIFDYILRDGGESERFMWRFLEFNR